MMVPSTTNFQQPTDFAQELTTTQMGTLNMDTSGAAAVESLPVECEEKQQDIDYGGIFDQLELEHVRNEIVNIAMCENLYKYSKEELRQFYEIALTSMKQDIASLMTKQQELFEKLFNSVNSI